MMKIIDRPQYLNFLISWKDKTELVKIITGIRRCGKSTIFKLFQKYLLSNGISKQQIQEINFEDANFSNLLDWKILHEHIAKNLIADKMNYVFFDEIQNVPEFQKAVNSLRIKGNVDLYLTGSNSSMLSGEFATILSGRYVEINMLPLSFKEYVSSYPFNATPESMFSDYLHNSSFPYTVHLTAQANPLLEKKEQWDKEQIRIFLKSIYDTIILKDIVERKKISNISRLESVIRFMFDNIGKETSIRNIRNTMKSDGRDVQITTIENYLEGMMNAFILYKANRYDIKGKKLLQTNAKYYLADIGLRYLLLGQGRDDGFILENVVYLELLRRGYQVFIGKIGINEVDFVAVKSDQTEYYQVAENIRSSETFQREFKSLNSIRDHNRKFLLTMDYPLSSQNGIQHLNLLKWLLE